MFWLDMETYAPPPLNLPVAAWSGLIQNYLSLYEKASDMVHIEELEIPAIRGRYRIQNHMLQILKQLESEERSVQERQALSNEMREQIVGIRCLRTPIQPLDLRRKDCIEAARMLCEFQFLLARYYIMLTPGQLKEIIYKGIRVLRNQCIDILDCLGNSLPVEIVLKCAVITDYLTVIGILPQEIK